MRFHLIDRIDSWTPGVRIAGRKMTSTSEVFWRQTAGRSVMPPSLVLEALCQAGAWLVLLGSDHRKRAALLSIGEVSFGRDVRPGDVLLLDARITALSDEAAVLDGTVRIASCGPDEPADPTALAATGIMCALLDADRLDDPAATRRMGEQLLRAGVPG
jgi:3-hydroxyacyl-[acyl-carrier-protein] dehydratase